MDDYLIKIKITDFVDKSNKTKYYGITPSQTELVKLVQYRYKLDLDTFLKDEFKEITAKEFRENTKENCISTDSFVLFNNEIRVYINYLHKDFEKLLPPIDLITPKIINTNGKLKVKFEFNNSPYCFINIIGDKKFLDNLSLPATFERGDGNGCGAIYFQNMDFSAKMVESMPMLFPTMYKDIYKNITKSKKEYEKAKKNYETALMAEKILQDLPSEIKLLGEI